jgi:hypothetical protein
MEIKYVKVTKLNTLKQTDSNIYDGYVVEGFTFGTPEVGERLSLLRTIRNSDEVIGRFSTTPVTKVETKEDHDLVYTENSIYKLEVVEKSHHL